MVSAHFKCTHSICMQIGDEPRRTCRKALHFASCCPTHTHSDRQTRTCHGNRFGLSAPTTTRLHHCRGLFWCGVHFQPSTNTLKINCVLIEGCAWYWWVQFTATITTSTPHCSRFLRVITNHLSAQSVTKTQLTLSLSLSRHTFTTTDRETHV